MAPKRLNDILFRRHRALWTVLKLALHERQQTHLVYEIDFVTLSGDNKCKQCSRFIVGIDKPSLFRDASVFAMYMQPGHPSFNIGSSQDSKHSCLVSFPSSGAPRMSPRTSRIIHLMCNWFSNKPPTTRHEHVRAQWHARTVTGRKRTNVCRIPENVSSLARGQCIRHTCISMHIPRYVECTQGAPKMFILCRI